MCGSNKPIQEANMKGGGGIYGGRIWERLFVRFRFRMLVCVIVTFILLLCLFFVFMFGFSLVYLSHTKGVFRVSDDDR